MQASIHSNAKASITASGIVADGGRGREVNMVAEMVAYGDSGAFLDKVGCAFGCEVGMVREVYMAAATVAARLTYLLPATLPPCLPAVGVPHLCLPGRGGGQEGD